MDNIHNSDWSNYKFGKSWSKTKNASSSCTSSENCFSTLNKINNSGSIIDVSLRVRNNVFSDITNLSLNANNHQISQNRKGSNSEVTPNNSITCNQKSFEENFRLCGETQTSGVSANILSDCFNNESSTSSSTSGSSSSFSEDDTLLKLISQGSFSIDPQKTASHETDSLLNTKYGSSNYKLPCNSNLKKNSQGAKRKLEFFSKLNTKLKKNKITKPKLNKNKYQADNKANSSQSSINDYFNIKKFSQNESLCSLTNINSLAPSNFEEPTNIEHFNLSNDNNNLNSEQKSNDDTFFESKQSSIFNLDDTQSKLSDSENKLNRKMLEISKKTSLIYTGPKVVSNFEEPTNIEHFNLFNDNNNLNSEQKGSVDTFFESKQSSLFNLDHTLSKLSDSENKLNRKMLEISKKTSLIYTGPKVVFDDQTKKNKNLQIIAKIEKIYLNFISSLKEADEDNNLSHTETMQNDDISEPHLTIRLDNKGRRRSSSLKVFLLGKIYSLICHNDRCSQRQVYYELKNYVSNQSMIANSLFSICLLLNVEPWYLPINSSGTGLVFGNLTIITSNNIVINCLNFGGTLIPQDVLQIKEFKSDAVFILIVEKDAIFKKLLDEDISKSLATSCIVITGKGFPDYNTRLFSKLLWRSLRIPIFILTDGDPYGIEIMLTYRFGSMKRPHFLEDITIPEIQWLGILPSDIETLSIPHQDLNQRDISKVKMMLERPYVQKYDWLKRELECMLRCNKKAGIEGVLDNYRSLTKFYIVSKLFSTDFY